MIDINVGVYFPLVIILCVIRVILSRWYCVETLFAIVQCNLAVSYQQNIDYDVCKCLTLY
jgi:hypothetical protein